MKIYLQSYIFDKMELEHVMEYQPPDPIRGRLHFHEYLIDAYHDYHANHLRINESDHDQLCSWCNLHASIIDICAEVEDDITCKVYSGDKDCQHCLSKTTWYKKL